MSDSAVRYFIPGASRLPHGWKAKLQQRRDQLADDVANGNASDLPDYRYRVGQIHGLREAIEILQQMEDEET